MPESTQWLRGRVQTRSPCSRRSVQRIHTLTCSHPASVVFTQVRLEAGYALSGPSGYTRESEQMQTHVSHLYCKGTDSGQVQEGSSVNGEDFSQTSTVSSETFRR